MDSWYLDKYTKNVLKELRERYRIYSPAVVKHFGYNKIHQFAVAGNLIQTTVEAIVSTIKGRK